MDLDAVDIPPSSNGTGSNGTGSNGTPRKGSKRRLDHVDAMRPVKQAGVVSTHSLLAFAPAASAYVGGSLVLLHVTRETFLFVSACMLTYSYQDLKLGRGDLGRFWHRRFVSVVIPYLCWTIVYFFITLHDVSGSVGADFSHLWYLVRSGYYQLYYLIVIMQFYVLFPLVLTLIRKAKGHHGLVIVISAMAQVIWTGLMHWQVVPDGLRGFWGAREIMSYQLYLLAGTIVAMHLDEFQKWLVAHRRLVIGEMLAGAALAETWYLLAHQGVLSILGSGSDPLQPIDIPFNVGAIASLYLLGMALVSSRRSQRLRAMVRSGSDNSYGVYLNQMVFILALSGVGWRELDNVVPWPLVSILTVLLVFAAGVLLTSILARTSLSVPLTGRQRQSWSSFLPARSVSTPSYGLDASPIGEQQEDEDDSQLRGSVEELAGTRS